MKVLEFNENYLRLLGTFSNRSDESKNEFFTTLMSYITFFGCLTLGSSAGMFAVQHFDDLNKSINSFIPCSGGLSAAIVFVSIGANMKTMKRLHNELQVIVDKGRLKRFFIYLKKILISKFTSYSADIRALEVYKKVERKCQVFTKAMTVIEVLSVFLFIYFPPIVHSIVSMSNGNYDVSTWFFPVNIVVFFDTSTIFGWYARLFIYIFAVNGYLLAITSSVSHLVSCCFYCEACCQHFQMVFQQIDEEITLKRRNRIKISDVRFRQRLTAAVLFHMQILK